VGPPGSTELWLVRHGASADSLEGETFELVEGQGDPPLSEAGHHQAERVGLRLAQEPFDALYVTTLQRTVQTAAPLVARSGMTAFVEADLREVFLGDWEGGILRMKSADGDPLFTQVLAEQRRLRWSTATGHRTHQRGPPGRAGGRVQPRRRHRRNPGASHRFGALRLRGARQRVHLAPDRDTRPLDHPWLQRHVAPGGLKVMARIVIVHGAFNELWGPNELKARWLPAVRDGLWHHGVEVESDDVAVCFYGDLFRHRPGSDEDRKLEQSRAGVADMLADMGGDAIAALSQAAGEATFDRTVDLATAMLTEADLRDRLRARIEAEVTDDTRVLVAHSLGTVLSYAALAAHDDWPVHTFVTLGSPLAVPMVFNGLEPAPVDGRGAWPGSVQRWVNVRALNDKACETCLADHFGPRVEELVIDNGHRAHAPEPYLNSSPTGAAIAAALNS
jgi:hypothetical protein